MAASVPTPKTGEKIFFSTLDAWNGYHSVPLEESAKKYFGLLTQWGTYRYRVVPHGFIGSGDHYVSVYNDIMNKLKLEEQKKRNHYLDASEITENHGQIPVGKGASTTPCYGPLHSNKASCSVPNISHTAKKEA